MASHFETHDALEAAAQQAEDAWRQGRWRDALDQYCVVFLRRWNDLADRGQALTPADLTILERISDFAVPIGLADQAKALLRMIAERYRRLQSKYWSDRITLKCIHLALNEHNVDAASEHFAHLCETPAPSIDDIQAWQDRYRLQAGVEFPEELFAQSWLEVGRTLHMAGQNRAALLCFDRGLAQASVSLGARLALSMAAISCLVELAELDAAAVRLESIEPVLDTSRYPAATTAWHEQSSKVYLLRGNLGAAQRELREVWHVCRAFGFVGPMLRSAVNVAQMLIVVNYTIEARRILERVTKVASSQGERRLADQAVRLLDVANARFLGEDRAAAVKDEQSAAARVETPDPGLFTIDHSECYTLAHFEDRALQFQWHLRRKEWPAARRCLNRLYPFRHTDSVLVHVRLDAMAAMLEYHAGDRAGAVKSLSEAAARFGALGLHPERWALQVLLARITTDGHERAILREENDRLLDEFGSTLCARDRVNYFLDKATQLDEAIAVRIRRIQEMEARIPEAPLLRRPVLRLALRREISQLLDAAYWQRESHNAGLLDRRDSRADAPHRTSLWRRLFWKSPAEATIAFLVMPDSTVVICQRWLSLTCRVAAAGRYELRRDVGAWHRGVARSDPEGQEAALRRVAGALTLNDITSSMPRFVRRLRILPDDALHGLPFAAVELPAAERARYYWSDRFAVSLAFQPERRPRLRQSRKQKVLLAGMSQPVAGLPPLRGTVAQIRDVRRWLEMRGHHTVCLMDDAATVESLCSEVRDATVLHISCHGEFVQDRPEKTGLLLTGPDGTQTLSLLQASRLEVPRLQHATLMACWGADNFVLPGRWVLSLPEALWRAGARSVLASLWEVEEDVAKRFVTLLYQNLARHRTDIALAATQRQMRAEGGGKSDPRAWAGFQLYGDPVRLGF